MSVLFSSKQIQYGIQQSTLQETGSSVCEIFAENHLCITLQRFSISVCLCVSTWACLYLSEWRLRLHTSVWKSPSDESGVLAEDESQFLLCSSIRSFCSPGTIDSSGVMVLKLSQELWSSGVDLSWWRRRTRKRQSKDKYTAKKALRRCKKKKKKDTRGNESYYYDFNTIFNMHHVNPRVREFCWNLYLYHTIFSILRVRSPDLALYSYVRLSGSQQCE